MKHLLVVCCLVALLAACGASTEESIDVTGSDTLIRIPLEVKDFTRIDANNGAQTSVEYGEDLRVELQVNENLEPYLDVRVDGDTLHIGLEQGSYTAITFQAQMTMPRLLGVTLNGGSAFRGEVDEESFSLELNGASIAIIGGTAGDVTIDANGGSQALLSDLAARDVRLDVNGASRVQVNASGEVTGRANGASSVTVGGSPERVDVEAEDVSTVIRE